MFDRSGSMSGDPLAAAKAALIAGLQLLTPADQFSVVAFDHEQLWWTGACAAWRACLPPPCQLPCWL